jgi:hypothetical protein
MWIYVASGYVPVNIVKKLFFLSILQEISWPFERQSAAQEEICL